MDKPISIAFRETRGALLDTINNSGLPLDMIGMLLAQIENAVQMQAEQAYLKDKENYNGTNES